MGASTGAPEAIVGGFFLRDPYRALGELWIDGRALPHEAVAGPHAPRRACVFSAGDGFRLAAREAGPRRSEGDLLQAGPLLVADGAIVFDPDEDREGFSAGAGQSTRTSRSGATRARRSGSPRTG